MDKKITEILEQVIQICTAQADIDEIILYGSRAKGTDLPRSDIDVALRGRNLDVEELSDELEAIDTLLKIDLVDIDHCRSELLRKEVEQDGITIYRKV